MIQGKKSVNFTRNYHLITGCVVGVIVLSFLLLPATAQWHAPGPMNTGHDDLACDQCHEPSEGSLRQKLQANIGYISGKRSTKVAIGNKPVSNYQCLDCHDRPEDRHPVFRFIEPRYKQARLDIKPQFCISCHREHSGKRVSVEPEFCRSCHGRLDLKKDPIDVSHAQLVKEKQWSSCLGCHDFHGNHRMQTKDKVLQAYSREEIKAYFNGEVSPYSKTKSYKARKKRTLIAENEN